MVPPSRAKMLQLTPNLRTALLWNIQIFQRKMISADCWMNSLTLVLMITKIICNKGRRGRINGI